MHLRNSEQWRHDHVFLGAAHESNEHRTRLVIALTATMMVAEIAAGTLFGSMALLADGWHMASHAGALSITVLGYYFARRYARDPRFSFGTWKIGELAGFSSALVLAVIALLMAYESMKRLYSPVDISFDEALVVAGLGLLVNLLSVYLLRGQSHDLASHNHGNSHDHHDGKFTDNNLRAAYLHVLADALTSLLAITALLGGRFFGWTWMDPLMGIVGAVVIARWSYGLIRDTGGVLLDLQEPVIEVEVRRAIESEADNRVDDLHLWRVGPRGFAAIVSLATHHPRPPAYYKSLLRARRDLAHITVEVNSCKAMSL